MQKFKSDSASGSLVDRITTCGHWLPSGGPLDRISLLLSFIITLVVGKGIQHKMKTTWNGNTLAFC